MIVQQTVIDRKPRGPIMTLRVITRDFPEGRRYAIARQYAPSWVTYDETDYATDIAAYLAAATIATQLGIQLDAPAEMKSRLVAYWYKRGRQQFLNDQPRALCANKYERQAYDMAEAELMSYVSEKDTKPGLSDYVPMAVRVGELAEVVA